MATHLRIEIEYGILEVAMTINPDQKTEFRSVWIKTAEQQLFHELETEYGFPRATCRSLVQLMQEFIEENFGYLKIYLNLNFTTSDLNPKLSILFMHIMYISLFKDPVSIK